jgi:hypothetical protein
MIVNVVTDYVDDTPTALEAEANYTCYTITTYATCGNASSLETCIHEFYGLYR